jgi:hypothetical protein
MRRLVGHGLGSFDGDGCERNNHDQPEGPSQSVLENKNPILRASFRRTPFFRNWMDL